MAKKTKYYVVWQGRKTGVFTDWKECEAQIKGFDDARYKSFESIQEAEAAIQRNYWEFVAKKENNKPALTKEAPASIGRPIKNSIAVDAAWNTASGDMEYQGIYYATGERLFLQGPFKDATNNIGEFLAIVHALAYLQKKESDLPIYSDSRTAISWIRKKHANTKLELTPRNKPVFEMLQRAERWLATNSFSNKILKWETEYWGENPADFGRK
ncbi:ribonuclease H1 domain-containing protein [Dyadobacter sediminis]|uniref:Ribonuclease H n=1 Tax=Dyadobacter sediminis TaxID=1493691 RepID=A0A5R9KAY4_9BACT|nr:ribonuclease H family protein [Dyadobacter sediminis]TLU91909.1 ribonuclease H [Dyadobacter sediminis]GGB99220.1 ribonuclease H [Dyadobacter sediminis]